MDEKPTSEKPTRVRHSRIGATLKALVRTRVTTGLITIIPIIITIWLIRAVFTWMRDASQWVVLAALKSPWFHKYIWDVQLKDPLDELLADPMVDWGIAIFSVFLTISLLYIVGIFAANIVGRRTLELLDRIVDRVPLVKTVYRASKQILAAFSGDQAQSFQRVALVPFPSERMRCVGFITNVFCDSVTGEELCSVFIPTTPNPTTGYLQILKRGELTEVGWTIEEAIRTIMSGGILKPDFVTIVPNKKLPPDMPEGVGPAPLEPPKNLSESEALLPGTLPPPQPPDADRLKKP